MVLFSRQRQCPTYSATAEFAVHTPRCYIPLPEALARGVLVKTLLEKNGSTLCEEELAQVVAQTEGFSGADMHQLCTAAVRRGLFLRLLEWMNRLFSSALANKSRFRLFTTQAMGPIREFVAKASSGHVGIESLDKNNMRGCVHTWCHAAFMRSARCLFVKSRFD